MLIDFLGALQHAEDALLGEGGGKDDREVGERGETLADGVLHVLHGFRALVGSDVPLVDDHHKAFLVLVDEGEYVEVLPLDAAGGIEHEDADVGILDGADGAHDGVELKVFADLVLLADAGGIDKVEVEAELVVAGVDAVAGGAGDVGDDVALLADEGVDDGALADVGTAYDGKAGDVGVDVVLGLLGELADDDVEQVAGTVAVGGGDAEGVAQAEGVELGCAILLLGAVGLVGGKDDGGLRAAQDVGHLLVEVGDAVLDIDHEEHHVGFLDGDEHLLADLLLEDVVGVDHPAAGIDDGELASAPFALAVLAVAGGARFLGHNGMTCFRQPVKQGRFAHIGPPNYR